jgi:Ser/Thr protein kinase RdoA (MazF antagonist)
VKLPVESFAFDGDVRGADVITHGHINDTWRIRTDRRRYVLQRINPHVFGDPVSLMDNIRRVTTHLRAKLQHRDDVDRRVLRLVPTRDGRWFYPDEAGQYWRAYHYIEGAHIHDIVETAEQVEQAAREFGLFQKLLADLPPPRLAETIPGFHDTPRRFAAFETAVAADRVNRAAQARAEIDFALRRYSIATGLVGADLPERVTHNDTKFNNIMLDDVTGEGLCVLDLDTVMPGLVLYDFGDMVRTATCPVAEDERDLSRVRMHWPLYEALVRGYLDSAGEFLTGKERRLLAFGGKLITFETGLRFLTDFLDGDRYFKVHRPAHNLERCRTQFRLVESIEQQEEAMNRLLES